MAICNQCLTSFIPQCIETLFIKTIYIQETLDFVFEDVNKNQYSVIKVTNEYGISEIDVFNDLPSGLLNTYAGNFILTLLDIGNQPLLIIPQNPQLGIFKDYYCAEISIINLDPPPIMANLFFTQIA